MEQDPSTPLLQHQTAHYYQQYVQPADTPAPPPAPFKLTGLQRSAVTLFAVVRIVRGLCFLAWPALGLSSFDIPESGATFLLGCLLGSRDLLLGGLLWTADPTSRREASRAVLFSLLGDVLDTCILVFSAACAWHWRNPVIEIIALAVISIAEHLTLYSMSEDDYDGVRGGGAAAYAAGLQRLEDKQRRLDNWLAEMNEAEAQQQAAPVPFRPSYYYRTDSSTIAPPASTVGPPASSIAPESVA